MLVQAFQQPAANCAPQMCCRGCKFCPGSFWAVGKNPGPLHKSMHVREAVVGSYKLSVLPSPVVHHFASSFFLELKHFSKLHMLMPPGQQAHLAEPWGHGGYKILSGMAGGALVAPGHPPSGEAALAAGAQYNMLISLGGSSSLFFLRTCLHDVLSILIQWLSNRVSSQDRTGLENAAQLSVTARQRRRQT